LVNSQSHQASHGHRVIGKALVVRWRQLIPADGRHGQAVVGQNARPNARHVGPADLGIGMLMGQAAQVRVQRAVAAIKLVAVMVFSQSFNPGGKNHHDLSNGAAFTACHFGYTATIGKSEHDGVVWLIKTGKPPALPG
jgi:hypothetical protein